MKLAAVGDLVLSRLFHSTWYRAVRAAYVNNPLWWSRADPLSPLRPSAEVRFRAREADFPLLHFAWNENTALLEARAITGTPNAARVNTGGWRTFRVGIALDRIVDLRGLVERRKIGTTVQELTGDWTRYAARSASSLIASVPPAPTQRFGAVLYTREDCQGFLTPSARNPEYPNLVVFPDRVKINGESLAVASK